MIVPTFEQERELWAAGRQRVAGIDEAGRGALAGPVVAAAAVIAPEDVDLPLWSRLRDSKLLSPTQRATLEPQIKAAAKWGIGSVAASVIDQIGIAAATRQAMQMAVAALALRPDFLLIDWVKLPQVSIAQRSMPKADLRIASVAAASILAKVYRDRLMVEMDPRFPQYGFAQHKGYGAATHLAAIAAHGPCVEHRHTFAPIAPQPPALFSR